jgi:drug/metabolite transporter superfamily protein YnfA
LAVSGTFALTPSTAGAAGPDPLGPTIAQLQAFYATAVANVEGGVVSTGVITDDLSIALDQVGCLVLTVTNVLGTTHAPPSFDCIL